MPTMAVPATPASHMNFLRVNEALTAISSGSSCSPIIQEEQTRPLGASYAYQVRVNANGTMEPAIAHQPPTHGFPLPAFAGTSPAGMPYRKTSHVCPQPGGGPLQTGPP